MITARKMIQEPFRAILIKIRRSHSLRPGRVLTSGRERRITPELAGGWLALDAELEVEVADMEGEVESTEVMDDQRREDDQQERYENPKQPPQEGRHTAL